ncbi:hypothetical protein [Tunicatimonas pelagia]|uniref:hypothetical protein n=1 Tax=Tunicatimonas pelagia TaxID=931531 RepID=UPI002665E7F3|nr:hypothetical protein [Tunicatimonas pelagia]WKN41234.1 hypothetical protein P0M28_19545 [Tunicatimonas pelagia]
MELNYFAVICFAWAVIGIITRIIIAYLGRRWNEWEEHEAYTQKKPAWLYFVAFAAVILVGYTWYMVFVSDVRASWLIALLLTLILIKVSAQMLNYQKFRAYVARVMNDPKLFQRINIGVAIYSLVLVALGIMYML